MRQSYVLLENYFNDSFIEKFKRYTKPLSQLPGCDAWDTNKQNKLLKDIDLENKNCYVKVLMPNNEGFHDIQKELLNIVNDNITKLNIDIYQSTHSIQYGAYLEGSAYRPHVDTTPEHSLWSKKLTIVALLSDRGSFEGGNFLLGNKSVLNTKGSVVIFPSYMVHSVTTITSGIRETLASWVVGPQWR